MWSDWLGGTFVAWGWCGGGGEGGHGNCEGGGRRGAAVAFATSAAHMSVRVAEADTGAHYEGALSATALVW